MARAGMADLIEELRGLTEAGTADYTLGTVTYWSDDHIQDALDRFRHDFYFEKLRAQSREISGTTRYYDYYSKHRYLEGTASGTAAWRVDDSTGDLISTGDYTVNLRAGHIRFDADTGGSARYLTGRSFNLYRSAAYVWRQRAGHLASRYDVQTDNQNLKRSQYLKHCTVMAEHYEQMAGPQSVRTVRPDTP